MPAIQEVATLIGAPTELRSAAGAVSVDPTPDQLNSTVAGLASTSHGSVRTVRGVP